ncbi:fanconi anemia group M protein [Methanolobus vulcani]|uniref:Fanconi anemia group M protein n=1 Tax=Methanolobus vulcani TaxID=38026 RepID=A0A7Z7AYP9_9EURY|nr:DEAD/DEAH box helicase [Methanolobus vulcani]SDF74276.1 fanconi anemia group M protein [Methanolobus vulcani]
MPEYIKHPLIKADTVEQRLYQLDLAGKALDVSTLVVLPTGLGKTVVCLLVMASRLEKFGGKVMVLSPTKPLVEQHASFFRNVMNIPEEEVLTFTGSVTPEKRSELWKTGKVIISTPQVIENDILTKRISLEDVAHITFDEAHRAVGNYAYTYIAEKYFETAKNPLCLGITASPGSSDEKIAEVCESLHIESVAVKTESDSDVKPYIHRKEIEWKRINLPDEMKEIKDLLNKVLEDRYKKLTELGYPIYNQRYVSKKDLLGLQAKLQGELRGGMPDTSVYSAISLLAEILKVSHAVEITETQGLEALRMYMERLDNEAGSKSGSKASKRLAEDLYIRQVVYRLRDCDLEHPKLEYVKDIVLNELENKPHSRVIVFANYRDTAEMLTNALAEVEGIRPVRFVGQASKYKDKGLTQKQQVEIIEHFKAGDYNVLVATSVAEEGLDIPSTDLVLFYEPIPSEIRSIQRKGRTGRKHEGRVVVLVTKGTRDEGYYWSSLSKERKMQNNMRELQAAMPARKNNSIEEEFMLDASGNDQKTLFEYDDNDDSESKNKDSIKIVVDQREIRSSVARCLDRNGAEIIVKTLEVGDYILSDRIAVERKETQDFVGSLIEQKLFEQIANLSRAYEKPILIIEGESLFNCRGINPNAIHGTLSSISLDFGVSIFYTRDPEDTAALLQQIAKREQVDEKREVNMHGKKAAAMLPQQQEYVVSSISDIGPKAARNLLKHFGSVENVMKASYKELLEVNNVGPKTAAKIREIIGSEYKR